MHDHIQIYHVCFFTNWGNESKDSEFDHEWLFVKKYKFTATNLLYFHKLLWNNKLLYRDAPSKKRLIKSGSKLGKLPKSCRELSGTCTF